MKILLTGCGHMGSAMLSGWLKRSDIHHVDVIEPLSQLTPADKRVEVHASIESVRMPPDIIVLAVKPQIIPEVCAALAAYLPEGAPVLSIAAGITLARLASCFDPNRPLVRAMPNTPGAIGQGITAFYKNNKLTQNHLHSVNVLLSALGDVVEVFEESQIDAVTAVSGSGPAYVFHLTECLEKAAMGVGLPPELAAQLARKTVTGAAALMALSPSKTPESLRVAVTSPGGTTAAALDVLGKNRALETLMDDAVKAAAKRSAELAQSQ